MAVEIDFILLVPVPGEEDPGGEDWEASAREASPQVEVEAVRVRECGEEAVVAAQGALINQ